MKTKIMYLDMLSSLIYLPFTIGDNNNLLNKKLLYICQYIYDNLDMLLYYNRQYSNNEKENNPSIYKKDKKIKYPLFKDGENVKNKDDILTFLKLIINDDTINQFKLIYLNDSSNLFNDKITTFVNCKSGNKVMGLYNKIDNEYIFVIRGTSSDIQWLDNARLLSKNITPVEKDAFDDFLKFYDQVNKYKLNDIIITGHSKGGATSYVIGTIINNMGLGKKIHIHALYGPFLNTNKINNLVLKDFDLYMKMIKLSESHVSDLVGGIFLDEKFFNNYINNFMLVGEFQENGKDFLKSHEPLKRFVKNCVIVKDKWYNDYGIPKQSNSDNSFLKLIFSISRLFVNENTDITYPFIVIIMKKTGIIGNNSIKGLFDDDILLLEDYEKTFGKKSQLVKTSYSLNGLKQNKEQLYLTYVFLLTIINDDRLNEDIILFFSHKENVKTIIKHSQCANIISTLGLTFFKTKKEVESEVFNKISYDDFTIDAMKDNFYKSIIIILKDDAFKSHFSNENSKKNLKKIKNYYGKNSIILSTLNVMNVFFNDKKIDKNDKKLEKLETKIKNNINLFLKDILKKFVF